jgi:hypothetical protein
VPYFPGGQSGEVAPLKKNWQFFTSVFRRFFQKMVFTDGFLFPVKELGLLTNTCYWIRFLDVP